MELWVPVELCVDFSRKNPLCTKMTKNGQKCPQSGIFSTVLKNFVINFCLKH